MSIYEFLQGFIIGSSLIIAIGPQNLFVINQGLKKNYTSVVVIICSLSDSLLIICGIYLSNSILNFNESGLISSCPCLNIGSCEYSPNESFILPAYISFLS